MASRVAGTILPATGAGPPTPLWMTSRRRGLPQGREVRNVVLASLPAARPVHRRGARRPARGAGRASYGLHSRADREALRAPRDDGPGGGPSGRSPGCAEDPGRDVRLERDESALARPVLGATDRRRADGVR